MFRMDSRYAIIWHSLRLENQLLTRGRGRELHALDAAAAAVLTPVRASSQRTSMDLSAHSRSRPAKIMNN